MIVEQIKDVKKFMSKILIENSFDSFLVNEVSITTFATYTIDGHINKDFFSESEMNSMTEKNMASWSHIKPICFNMIKGTKTPLKFKFIFAMNRDFISNLISSNNIDFSKDKVNELFLNIKFENGQLTYTTGISLKEFSMDRTLEKSYDKAISNFISTLF